MCGFPDLLVFVEMRLADRAAIDALKKEPTVDLMPFSDLKPLIAKCVNQVWQKEWDEAVIVSNKLHAILPKLSDKWLSLCRTRKEDTVLYRRHSGFMAHHH